MNRILTGLSAVCMIAAPAIAADWQKAGSERAKGWVEAFNRGDAAAFEAFVQANFSAEAVARKTPEQRREMFEDITSQAGKLTVEGSEAGDGEIRLSAKDQMGTPLKLMFKIDPAPPHKITAHGVQAGN